MHIGELRPKIGDFAMRMAFLVSKKVLFLAWQSAARALNDNANDDLQQSCGVWQPMVAVKGTENDDKNENENKASRTKQKMGGGEDFD